MELSARIIRWHWLVRSAFASVSYKSYRIPTSEAIFYSSLDTIIALSLALFVNAAILIVAAAAFFDPSGSTQDAPSVSEAYDLLAPVLGKKVPELGEGYIF